MGMKTTILKPADVQRSWYVVDATERPAGRLAVRIAEVLRGKDKPTYTPHVDMGDFVVVVNAEKVLLTGTKEETKVYKKFTGFPDGLKQEPAKAVRARNPERILEQAVKGMLPKNKLARVRMTRLKVYAGPEHPHTSQKPQALAV
jgi:large subunit ribosomal protein L13